MGLHEVIEMRRGFDYRARPSCLFCSLELTYQIGRLLEGLAEVSPQPFLVLFFLLLGLTRLGFDAIARYRQFFFPAKLIKLFL